MTYTNAEKLIKSAASADSAENLRMLLSALGSPEKKLGIIKVYGESGKSSVTAMVSHLLSAAGYRVGRLTTPIIGHVPECIRIYERSITAEFFSSSAEKVYRATVKLRKDEESNVELSVGKNDLLFAVSLAAFADADCDYAVIEIPTENISHVAFSSSVLSVISTVDDTSTARSICARLDRNGNEIVTALQSREVYKIIYDKCAEINSRLSMPLRNAYLPMTSTIKRREFTYSGRFFAVGTGAEYQVYNLLTTLECAEALKRGGIKIAGTDICSAMLCEGLPLRFEMVSVMPTIVVDRADTQSKQRALFMSLDELSKQLSGKQTVICPENSDQVNELLASPGASVIAIPTKGARKAMRPILSGLCEDDILFIIGSSEYCEEMAKITKEILM